MIVIGQGVFQCVKKRLLWHRLFRVELCRVFPTGRLMYRSLPLIEPSWVPAFGSMCWTWAFRNGGLQPPSLVGYPVWNILVLMCGSFSGLGPDRWSELYWWVLSKLLIFRSGLMALCGYCQRQWIPSRRVLPNSQIPRVGLEKPMSSLLLLCKYAI